MLDPAKEAGKKPVMLLYDNLKSCKLGKDPKMSGIAPTTDALAARKDWREDDSDSP